MLTDLIYYDLKVATLIAVFYLFYQLLLARETTHTLNRAVLLSGIALSAVLPLCIITLHRSEVAESGIQPFFDGPAVEDATAQPVIEAMEQSIDWTIPLAVVLLVGTLIRFIYVSHSYEKLKRLMRSGEMYTLPTSIRVCVVDAPVAPFSWMQTIVLSRADWSAGAPSILAHEEAHVRRHHSYDIIVVEVLTALQWFNPVVWFLRQELRTLHEYEADTSVLSRGFDESQYIYLLMQKATGIQACTLANGINTHKTKKRILMMLKPKSKRSAWLKALYIVPVALGSLAMTARTVVDYETTAAKKSQLPMLRVFNDSTKGKCYQIRHTPGVKFFFNGKNDEIPDNRPIALEESKTTLQSNGVAVDDLPLSQIPVGMLKEIHIDEVSPDHFVANLVTEEKGKTIVVVDGDQVSQEMVNGISKEDIVNVDVIYNKELCRKYDPEASTVVMIRTKQSDDPVFDICEQMPTFPGGDAKLMEFIARNIKYPKVATENGVQGRVVVRFIVEKDGTLSNAKVLEHSKTSGANTVVVTAYMPDKEHQDAEEHKAGVQALRDEAIRVVNAMPKWTPGKQNGKTVRCYFVIPVTYRLN